MNLNGTTIQEFDMDPYIDVFIYDVAVLHRNYDDILYYFSCAPFAWLYFAWLLLFQSLQHRCLCVVKDVVDMVRGAHDSTRHRINDHALFTHTAREKSDGSTRTAMGRADVTLALVDGNTG